MFKSAEHHAPHLAAIGPDGRSWFSAHDDEAGWERIAANHKRAVKWGLPQSEHFCVANSHIDKTAKGPIERLFIRKCGGGARYSTHNVQQSCERSAGSTAACFAEAAALIEEEQPLRPLMPADYAQTVAVRSGITIRDDASGYAFVSTVEDARLCVLGDRMAVRTPLREAIKENCQVNRPSFSAIYDVAREAGGDRAAALHAAGLVNEK